MEWISVKDRLPEEGVEVLAYDHYDIVQCYLMHGEWRGSTNVTDAMKDGFVANRVIAKQGDRFDFITHWMPLPEPPNATQ